MLGEVSDGSSKRDLVVVDLRSYQEETRCYYQLASLVVTKSDWPVFNVIDRSSVQSPSRFSVERSSALQMLSIVCFPDGHVQYIPLTKVPIFPGS